jgi:hypothetical protein
MSISRNNYESYLIDYLDGKLNTEEEKEVLLFLQSNPDIQEEFNGITDAILDVEEDTILQDKEQLKKPAYPAIKKDVEHLLIAELENDLSTAEKIKLQHTLVAYPEAEKDRALFYNTLLKPDFSIQYPHKQTLKRRKGVVLTIQHISALAASLILVAGLYYFIQYQPATPLADANITKSNTTQLAQKQPKLTAKNGSSSDAETIKFNSNRKTQNREKAATALREPNHHSFHNDLVKNKRMMVETKTINSLSAKIAQEDLRGTLSHKLTPINMYLSFSASGNQNQFPDIKELASMTIDNEVQKVLQEQNKPQQPNKPMRVLSMLLVAYNKIVGDEAKVKAKYNDSGQVAGIHILANNFEFYTNK